MEWLQRFFKNKYFKFSLFGTLYVLWVIWLDNYWWLAGLIIIFDIYISKIIPWSFWQKKDGTKSPLLEWIDAFIFALIAVAFINIFFFQNYRIPTGSMEKSLLPGDHLFVSKLAYGPRLPNTPIALPFAQHTLPGTQKRKSYLEWIKRPYRRLKGFGDITRNNVVVFNFPEGDTVVVQNQSESYYQVVRSFAEQFKGNDVTLGKSPLANEVYLQKARKFVWEQYDILTRPIDRRDNYIKRCIALPGDTLKIVNARVYVNGKLIENKPEFQYRYKVFTTRPFNLDELKKIGISDNDVEIRMGLDYIIHLNNQTRGKILSFDNIKEIIPVIQPENQFDPKVFPHNQYFRWNVDNVGPLHVPQKGDTVLLTKENFLLYERIIKAYEGNKLEIKGDSILINGAFVNHYVIKMDYYWMMGDNRHYSSDSRYWGFVPENHIIGSPKFVWLSINKNEKFPRNIRFRRIFKSIS